MSDKIPFQCTPRGHAAYAWLAKKDTKFNKAGVYKVTLVLDKKEIGVGLQDWGNTKVPGKQWVKELIALGEEHKAGKFGEDTCPVKDGDKTGKEEFAGKLLIPMKSAYKPEMLDTKQNPLPGSLTVFSGDEIKVLFECKPQQATEKVKDADGNVENVTKHYLSLYLKKIMLCKKNSTGNNMFGDEEEDGFVVSDADRASSSGFGDDNEEEHGDAPVDQGGDF